MDTPATALRAASTGLGDSLLEADDSIVAQIGSSCLGTAPEAGASSREAGATATCDPLDFAATFSTCANAILRAAMTPAACQTDGGT